MPSSGLDKMRAFLAEYGLLSAQTAPEFEGQL
jgi:hypothetical protein